MSRTWLRVVGVGMVLAALGIGYGAGEKQARPVSTTGGYPGPHDHEMPSEWGEPIAIATSAAYGGNVNVLLQAEDGTLRVVVLSGKKSWLEHVVHRGED